MKLPKTLFIRMERGGANDPEPYPVTFNTMADAVEDDGPTAVGTYKLVEVTTLRKIVQQVVKSGVPRRR